MKKLILILVLLLLVSCGLDVELPTPTPTLTPTLTPTSTSEPTFIPMFRFPRVDEDIDKKHKLYFPLIHNNGNLIKSLGNEFLKHKIKFGFAVSSRIRTNATQNYLVTYHAKVVTMENAYKMNDIQQIKGVFNFKDADQIILFGEETNLDVYGHGISWARYNPIWLDDIPDSKLAYELKKHVSRVCSHYQGLSGVDVANEAYMGSGGSLLAGEWLPLGNDYVNISFNSCRDSINTKIFYNSFFWHTKDAEKAIQLLDLGLADGIGVQIHLTEGVDYQGEFSRIKYIIQESRKRGTPVRFSEVGVLANSDEKQAEIYREVVRLALDNSDVVTDFIVWGVTDPAWRGNVTLFNNDGSPKQSAYAILKVLEED
jgi:endo-1,4-beta-xylanase